MKRVSLILFAIALGFVATSCRSNTEEISYTTLHSKIAGAWLGQLVGNIYELVFVFKTIDVPDKLTEPRSGNFRMESGVGNFLRIAAT